MNEIITGKDYMWKGQRVRALSDGTGPAGARVRLPDGDEKYVSSEELRPAPDVETQ